MNHRTPAAVRQKPYEKTWTGAFWRRISRDLLSPRLVRFLRDANILQHVSHITAVSGGSIMAAHLGLNWDRYTGSEQEFDEAASQL
jgi:hypothetical protein